ncbi:hypothetical protein HQQ80_12390 [Microbacteriaceae bacterium VKM Ac-2855]|nr:hypothetical protein [Microbacteriaceae bacterium VKM Ac-2855]
MSVPLYLRVLWSYKWLLAVGLIVAVLAAMVAGFTIKDGAIVSRAESTYRSSTTILLGGGAKNPYVAETPGQAITEGTTAAQQADLTNTAVIYAYLVSGSATRASVEAIMGPLGDTESLSAVRRTTQPAGDETQGSGRFVLPILSIVGTSTDPDRANEIAATATQVFQDNVKAQQDAAAIADNLRVTLTVTDTGDLAIADESNPVIPIALTGVGVFLAFIALAFILYNIRVSRERVTSNRVNAQQGASFRRGPALGTSSEEPALAATLSATGSRPAELASSGKRSAT